MARSRSSSPTRKESSSKGRSPLMTAVMENMQVQFVLAAVFIVLIIVAYISMYDVSWWTAVSSKTPSWGNSQWLIGIMFLLWYLAVTAIATMGLLDPKNRSSFKMFYVAMFVFVSLEAVVIAYLYSNKQQKYNYGFTAFMVAVVLTLLLVYWSYANSTRETMMTTMIPSVVALGTGAYLTYWAYKVKNA